MTSTYRECPACGKRALSIAMRCPGCAYELPPQPVKGQASRDTGRLGPLLAIVVILLATGGIGALVFRRGAAPTPEETPAAAVRADAESPVPSNIAHGVASPVSPDSAPGAGAVPRIARTWTNVRDRRSTRGGVVAILLPGDTVLADSLAGGWWRVALEGRVLGYLYAGTLVGK